MSCTKTRLSTPADIPEIRSQDEPLIFAADSPDGQDLLMRLKKRPGVRCADTIYAQIQDLIRARNPKSKFNALNLNQAVLAHLNGVEPEQYGKWVYFPWNGSLVHLLNESEFTELRSNRNHNKITQAEQQKLQQATVGIVGLSVGNAIAITMTMEGTYGHLVLADFDRLDLSNLNRINAGVQDLGICKATITARQIYQLNPFARLTVFRNGVNSENIDEFFTSGGGIDCLIDECDDIAVKFKIRERARELGIPVVMSTSDRGMFDIERYDLQPERFPFHGAFGDQTPKIASDMSNEEKLKYVLPILGLEAVSARAAASMIEIEETLSTWPQLAEDVMLGGAMTTNAIRRLVLGQPLESGRFYLDLASFGTFSTAPTTAPTTAPCKEPQASTAAVESARNDLSSIPDWMTEVAEAACLAPSGGNCQPWAFSSSEQALTVYLDRERGASPQDAELKAAHLAIGAAIFNARLAGASESRWLNVCYHSTQDKHPQTSCRYSPIAEVTLENRSGCRGEEIVQYTQLRQQIGLRATNRQSTEYVPFSDRDRLTLSKIADQDNCLLEWIESDAEKSLCAHAIGLVDRVRFLCPELHSSLMSELRWTTNQARLTNDGIDIASLHLTALQQTVLHCLRRPDVVRELRSQGLGRRIGTICRDAVLQSSAVGMFSHHDDSNLGWVRFGETLQHTWLTSTQQGWAWYPMTVVFILRYFRDQLSELFTQAEREDLEQAANELDKLFPKSVNSYRGFLFCVRPATEVAVRSRRRELSSCWIS